MRIPQMTIHSQNAKLGLNIQNAIQKIKQPIADLRIQQPAAKLSIRTTDSSISIDSTQARAEMDLKSVAKRMEDFARIGREKVIEGIGRRASEGRQLMEIENGGNPIVSQSASKGRQMYRSLGIKFIPSYGSVKVQITPGDVEVKAEPQKPTIQTKVNKPIHEYTPGTVSGYWLQQPTINIDWTMPQKVDISL